MLAERGPLLRYGVGLLLAAVSLLLLHLLHDTDPGDYSSLAHIFGRYWQARQTAHQGTGLGLFISKSIVEAHGGRIEVATRPGAGSVFSVFLPAS